MNEGILDTWIVPGQIRKANLCRGLGNRYTPAGIEVLISAVAHTNPHVFLNLPRVWSTHWSALTGLHWSSSVGVDSGGIPCRLNWRWAVVTYLNQHLGTGSFTCALVKPPPKAGFMWPCGTCQGSGLVITALDSRSHEACSSE